MSRLPAATGRAAKPVVIYRLGSLGDTIVSLPCFHAIARATPGARRIALTNVPVSSKAAPLEGILGGSGLISGKVAYPVGTRSLQALWDVRRQLRASGADTLYYLTPARGLTAAWRDWLFFKLCGFKQIIGAPLTPDLQRNRVVNEAGHIEQECVRLARCMARLGPIELNNPSMWDLKLTAQERQRAGTLMSPLHDHSFLAINMGGKVAINDWGISNWLNLLQSMSAAQPALGLLIVGAAEDSERAQQIAQVWQGPVVNSCGQLSPRESAAAMEGAALFIGHDSGPMHLAAAMGVKCIGLFGDNNPPAKWHPYGQGNKAIHDMRGVTSITVEHVLGTAQTMLKARP
jgi:heptosyltransferase III